MTITPSSNTGTYCIVAGLGLLATALNPIQNNSTYLRSTISVQEIHDETEYLMQSEENKKRLLNSLKETNGTTYQNLQKLKRAYNI